MNKKSIGIIIAAIVIVIIAVAYWQSKKTTTTTSDTTSDTNGNLPSGTQPNGTPTSPGLTPSPVTYQSFTVHANDTTADLLTVAVKKGVETHLTFAVDASGTSVKGLQFESSIVNSKAILPGSTGTVVFSADNSFIFTVYGGNTRTKRPYVIKVVLQ